MVFLSEIESLKIVKNQTQIFQTSNVQHFKAALHETETITLLELPSLAPTIKNATDIQFEVYFILICNILFIRNKKFTLNIICSQSNSVINNNSVMFNFHSLC